MKIRGNGNRNIEYNRISILDQTTSRSAIQSDGVFFYDNDNVLWNFIARTNESVFKVIATPCHSASTCRKCTENFDPVCHWDYVTSR